MTGRQLAAALKFCRKGDALLATKLDRLGRSVHDLAVLGRTLEEKGVHLKVLDQAVDTSTAAGRAFYGMLSVFSQFETDIRRERQAEGIARIMADPKLRKKIYKGGVPTVPKAQIIKLFNEGWNQAQIRIKLSEMVGENGKALKAGRTSIWKVLKDEGLLERAAT